MITNISVVRKLCKPSLYHWLCDLEQVIKQSSKIHMGWWGSEKRGDSGIFFSSFSANFNSSDLLRSVFIHCCFCWFWFTFSCFLVCVGPLFEAEDLCIVWNLDCVTVYKVCSVLFWQVFKLLLGPLWLVRLAYFLCQGGHVSVLNSVVGQSILFLISSLSVIWTEYSQCSAIFLHSTPLHLLCHKLLEVLPSSSDKNSSLHSTWDLQASSASAAGNSNLSSHPNGCLLFRFYLLVPPSGTWPLAACLWQTLVSFHQCPSLKGHNSAYLLFNRDNINCPHKVSS